MNDKNEKTITDHIALGFFFFSLAFFAFIYGVGVGKYHYFPYQWLMVVEKGLQQHFFRKADVDLRPHHLQPIWYDYSGVRIHDANSMAPGVTLLTGYWRSLDWKPGIRLIESTGKVLHEWKTNPAEIWPVSPYNVSLSKAKNKSSNYVHGCYLFENGDILFNIEYMGLVRMNAHGEILWRLDFRTHHSVHRDESGDFWVCGMKSLEGAPNGQDRMALFPGLHLPLFEDFILKVSEQGKILRKISILKLLYDCNYQKLMWQASFRRSGDILHLNDVEPLSPKIADQYPLFNAGDLVVSCRFLNTIFVIDQNTEHIKWLYRDLVQHHDPDFIGNGKISVFDNRTDGYNDGHVLGGSRIITVDTNTKETNVLYPITDTQNFHTPAGGKAQILSNDNILITEAQRGRVFEVDRSGKTVWEWVSEAYNNELVPEVLEGTRYPITPEQIATWK